MAVDMASIGQKVFGFAGKTYIYMEVVVLLAVIGLIFYFVFLRMSFKIKTTIIEKQGNKLMTNLVIDWDHARIKTNKRTKVTKFELWKNKSATIDTPDQTFFHQFRNKGKALFLMKISDLIYVPIPMNEAFSDTPFATITNVDVDYVQSKIRENATFYSNKSWWEEHGATVAIFGALIIIVIFEYITSGKFVEAANAINSGLQHLSDAVKGGTAILPG